MPLDKNHLRVFMRFCAVGVVNTAIDYGLFILLYYHFYWWLTLSQLTSFTVATLNSYLFNSAWTFGHKSQGKHRPQFLRFVVVVGGGLLLSLYLIHGFSRYMPVYLAKIAVIGVTVMWNYTGSTLFVFRKR